jgi:probable F420-dependent oxidoreductase
MEIGLNCAGVGPLIAPDYVAAAARATEAHGFASFWVSEHVALFERYSSDYPYSKTFPYADPTIAFMDPIVTLTWAAAATRRLRIGTCILILPQRNPLVLAKQLATLDHLSGGRLTLGIGTGWSAEECRAIGVPFEDRGTRLVEYVEAMRTLWRDSASSYQGATVAFSGVYCYPKPVRGDIPIMIGGESDVVLRRVVRLAEGWLPMALNPDEAPARIALLRRMANEQGRDGAALRVTVGSFRAELTPDKLKRYRDAGVAEVIIGAHDLPPDPERVDDAVARLAEETIGAL